MISRTLFIGCLGVVLGFVASRWISSGAFTVAEYSNDITVAMPSVLPQPDNHTDDLRSFRELLLAQKGQPTLAATRALFDRVRATRSPALLEEMRFELTLMPRVIDPAIGLLDAAMAEHLDHHSPTSRAALQGNATARQSISDRQNALEQWAQRDPDAAFAFALNERIVNHRPRMLKAVLRGTVRTDPEAAYRLWSTLTDLDLRHRLSKTITWGVATAMPERHAEWAAAFPSEIDRVREFSFREWSAKSPEEALAALNELKMAGEDVGPVLNGILAGWGEKHPASAAAWGEEHGVALPREAMLQWASDDPAAALAYALAHPDDHRVEAVATAWLQNDASGTLTWIEENLSNAERLEVYRQAFRDENVSKALSEAQRGEMAAWLAGDPHPHAQDWANEYLRSFEDTSSAQQWIETLPVVQERRLMPLIFDKWVRESPEDAAGYIKSLPTPRAQAAMLREALQLGPRRRVPGVNETLKEWAQRHLSPEAWEYLNPK